MDIDTITDVVRSPDDPPGSQWRAGDAWLAGGTWLFSDQQPELRRLIDLAPLGWDELESGDAGLRIGAMCTIRDLYAFTAPGDWPAATLLRTSCEAFLASFKVWNSATVGGNICMALPAGPMITLTVALEARYTVLGADGHARRIDAAEFVTGDHRTVLEPGEVLRAIEIPAHALRKRVTHRRFALTALGRSTIYMVGTRQPGQDHLLLTITAATVRPVRLAFAAAPSAEEVRGRIEELPEQIWFADANGSPAHRRHLALHFAEEIRAELSGGADT